MFSALGAFSAQNFYSCPKSGTISGAAPFTAGVLFSLGAFVGPGQGLFGDFDVGGPSGFLFAQTLGSAGLNTLAQITGTMGGYEQDSGPNGTVGSPINQPAGALYDANAQNAINSLLTGLGANTGLAGTQRNFTTPNLNRMCLLTQVYDGVNETLYFNGQAMGSRAYVHSANANPLVIGNALFPATFAVIAGAFYHSAALDQAFNGAIMAACALKDDMLSPAVYYGSAFDLDYVWSVKTGCYDARANWYSKGLQTPIAMVRSGAPLAAAVNYPWA
jgi:hypothetical protein